MDKGNLTPRDINILGSYWGILKHADCRNLWYKYTTVRNWLSIRELSIRYIYK